MIHGIIKRAVLHALEAKLKPPGDLRKIGPLPNAVLLLDSDLAREEIEAEPMQYSRQCARRMLMEATRALELPVRRRRTGFSPQSGRRN
jgi:hypothetical protein